MKAPKDNKMSELAILIDTRLTDISGRKSQREVAEEVGFPNSNMMSYLKRGATKLSLDRVEAMAKALDLELETVMLPALRQSYSEDVIDVVRRTFSNTETKTEHQILAIARKYMDTRQPLSFETRERLKEIFSENKPAGT